LENSPATNNRSGWKQQARMFAQLAAQVLAIPNLFLDSAQQGG
jgi:hypothetical protein